MKVICPQCGFALAASNMNVATDVAVCPECDNAFAISAIVAAGFQFDLSGFDIAQPPQGVWFEETVSGWRVAATTRSPIAWFLVPFMCVWSGFSLGGIYGTQIVNGEFNLAMSLFGIPFLLGTLLFGSIALMAVCGRVVVAVERGNGRVFVGVGPCGWTRRFDWNAITAVEEEYPGYDYSGSTGVAISLVGQSRVKFGSMLTEARRYFVLQTLRKLLALRGK